MHHLPSEIIEIILSFFLIPEQDGFTHSNYHTLIPIITLNHTCSELNSKIFHNQQFWNLVSFNFSIFFECEDLLLVDKNERENLILICELMSVLCDGRFVKTLILQSAYSSAFPLNQRWSSLSQFLVESFPNVCNFSFSPNVGSAYSFEFTDRCWNSLKFLTVYGATLNSIILCHSKTLAMIKVENVEDVIGQFETPELVAILSMKRPHLEKVLTHPYIIPKLPSLVLQKPFSSYALSFSTVVDLVLNDNIFTLDYSVSLPIVKSLYIGTAKVILDGFKCPKLNCLQFVSSGVTVTSRQDMFPSLKTLSFSSTSVNGLEEYWINSHSTLESFSMRASYQNPFPEMRFKNIPNHMIISLSHVSKVVISCNHLDTFYCIGCKELELSSKTINEATIVETDCLNSLQFQALHVSSFSLLVNKMKILERRSLKIKHVLTFNLKYTFSIEEHDTAGLFESILDNVSVEEADSCCITCMIKSFNIFPGDRRIFSSFSKMQLSRHYDKFSKLSKTVVLMFQSRSIVFQTELNIEFCNNVSAIENYIYMCPTVTELQITDCENLFNLENSNMLQRLIIKPIKTVTLQDGFFKNIPQIRYLRMSLVNRVEAPSSVTLQHLVLSKCSHVSIDISMLPTIKYISLKKIEDVQVFNTKPIHNTLLLISIRIISRLHITLSLSLKKLRGLFIEQINHIHSKSTLKLDTPKLLLKVIDDHHKYEMD